ncbi:lysophospholipase [Colletotrichum graminicola M1.001]|uniref:Lysophospholipase n=1 Tax=Colletotrichum graminicola (strain M1.001 / M2 / FGSC 10212) TaxID=645133 RepID=E3QI99_COLGM|nr:lysophospholipase [Colletotrichum graminicola M1.001]EFQ30714.1 lysophospholipase [Colletotrichum graminicola M1.001]
MITERVVLESRPWSGYPGAQLVPHGFTADALNAWFIDEWYDTPIFVKRELRTGPPTSDGIVPHPQSEDDRRSAAQGNILFPRIPDVETLATRNLTKQPTFFGCNAAGSSPMSLSSFTDSKFDLTADKAFNLATYGRGTVGSS